MSVMLNEHMKIVAEKDAEIERLKVEVAQAQRDSDTTWIESEKAVNEALAEQERKIIEAVWQAFMEGGAVVAAHVTLRDRIIAAIEKACK